MKSFQLTGTVRTDLGKKAAKAFRLNGDIPCELYGQGRNVHFTCKESDLRKLIYTPDIHYVELTIGADKCLAIIQELQFHPISDRVIHIDFLEVTEDKPIVIKVPVRLEGLAAGVKAGGKLALNERKLKVQGLIKNIPEQLVINVESLEVGKAIQVKNLEFEGLKMLNPANTPVCCVKVTRGSRAAATEEK